MLGDVRLEQDGSLSTRLLDGCFEQKRRDRLETIKLRELIGAHFELFKFCRTAYDGESACVVNVWNERRFELFVERLPGAQGTRSV